MKILVLGLLTMSLAFTMASPTYATEKTPEKPVEKIPEKKKEKKVKLKPIKEVFEPRGDFPEDKFWKVAVIQWNPVEDAPVGIPKDQGETIKQANRDEMARRIRDAASKGAKYIVLPEFAVVGYPDIPELPAEEDEFRNREDIAPYVEPLKGPSTAYFAKLAKELKVWIQFGFAEVGAQEKYYNNAAVLNDKGVLVASYRKQSLYEMEKHFLSAGNSLTVFETPAGKFGLIICADVYHYDITAAYTSRGVKVLSLSTSWAQMNTGMKHFTDSARDNQVFILAANQTYFPDSGVINPDGKTQSHIRQSGDAIAYGYLPLLNPKGESKTGPKAAAKTGKK